MILYAGWYYLLAAYVDEFPPGSVFLCVVDPGVGSDRGAGVLKAGGRWYVGPDNGLFEMVIRRSGGESRWRALESPSTELSATFHGRDLFAPAAARLSLGGGPEGAQRPVDAIRRLDWPDDLREVVYIDGFGNAITGIRALAAPEGAQLSAAGKRLKWGRTFSDVPPGEPFCYGNSNGLVEIAVNQGRADKILGLAVGAKVWMEGA